MKRQFLFGTVLAAAMAVGVGAQTPQTPPPSQTPSPTQSPSTFVDGSAERGQIGDSHRLRGESGQQLIGRRHSRNDRGKRIAVRSQERGRGRQLVQQRHRYERHRP